MRISTHTATGTRRLASWPILGALVLGSSLVTAAPVNINYFKDAQALNTSTSSSASTSGISFFSTGLAGLNQTSYTQALATVSAIESQIPGSGSSTTSYQASIAAGRLRASSSSTTAGSYDGPIGTGLSTNVEQVMRIRDTLNATAGNAGSVLSLTLSLQLDSLISSSNVPFGSNSVLCGFGSISLLADVGNTQVATLVRNLCVGSDQMTISAVFDVIDGQDFDLHLGMGIWSQAVMGAANRLGSWTGINAMNSGLAFMSGPANFQLTSTSGYTYLTGGGGGNRVSEPATLALVAFAVLMLPAARRWRA